VTAVGVAFIALLTWVCYRGIEVSARLQQVLLVIEVGALTVFAVVALVKAGTGHGLPGAAHPSVTWLPRYFADGITAPTQGGEGSNA
jgi:amino acid transporter